MDNTLCKNQHAQWIPYMHVVDFSNLDFHAQKTGNQQIWQKIANYNRLTAWN